MSTESENNLEAIIISRARLIAAAPDLLAALQTIAYDENCEILQAIDIAKKAIAKAKGETL